MVKWEKCNKCNHKGIVEKIVDGKYQKSLCTCKIEYNRRRLLENFGYPPSVYDFNINSFQNEKTLKQINKLKKYIKQFKTKFSNLSLYFYGENINQILKIAQWVGRELIFKYNNKNRKIFSAPIITMYQLVRLLNEDMNYNNSFKIVNSIYQNCNLLILDDCFTRDKVLIYNSGYQIPSLYDFLKERMESKEKPILFISDISAEQIDISMYKKSIKKLICNNVYSMEFNNSITKKEIDNLFEDEYTCYRTKKEKSR